MICTRRFLKNITYKCLMSLVQLPYPGRTQNIKLVLLPMCVNKVNVNKHYVVKTIILISWIVSPYIHISVCQFESSYISPGPSQLLTDRRRLVALLLFQLLIASLSSNGYNLDMFSSGIYEMGLSLFQGTLRS